MLYFAYGSNMNLRQMHLRCPGAEPIGSAALPGYRIAQRVYADIDREPGSWVWGVLWEITATHLRSLDRYEGYPAFYTRYQVHAHPCEIDGTPAATVLPVIVYEMTPACKADRDGEPYSRSYRAACAEGARKNGVPVNAFAP